jgi:hypothetical protein
LFRKNLPSGASALALVLTLVAPASAGAVDRFYATPSIGVSQGWEDNFFSSEDDPVSQWTTQVNPALLIRRTDDLGRTEAGISFNSRMYDEFSDENSVDRTFSLVVDRALTKRAGVSFDARLSQLGGTDGLDEGAQGVRTGGRPDQDLTSLGAGWRYALTRRNSLRVNGGLYQQEFSGDTGNFNRDLDSQRGSVSLVRQWSDYDSSVLSLGVVSNDYQALNSADDVQSLNTSLTSTWNRVWNSRWSTTVTLGLRQLDTQRNQDLRAVDDPFTNDNPATFDTGDDAQQSITFIPGVSIRRGTDRTRTELSFSRTTQPASGSGTDKDVDELSLRHWIKLTSRLGVTISGSWVKESTTSEFLARNPAIATGFGPSCFALPGSQLVVDSAGRAFCAIQTDSAFDGESYSVRVQFEYRIGERLNSYTQWEYFSQTGSGDTTVPEFGEHRFLLGFRYSFDYDLL